MAYANSYLAQGRYNNTTFNTLYTYTSGTIVPLRLVVSNTSGATASFYVCFDNDGTTYDETTSLFWNISLQDGEPFNEPIWFPMGTTNGSIGVKNSVANSMTFTIWAQSW